MPSRPISMNVLSRRRRAISDMPAPAPEVMRLTRSVSPFASGGFGGGGRGGFGGGGTGGFGGGGGGRGFGAAGFGGSVGTFWFSSVGDGTTGFGGGGGGRIFATGSSATGSGICNANSSSRGFAPPDGFSSLPAP